MTRSALIQQALESSWHRDTAAASLERWLEICARENWGEIPHDISSLIAVFGASWYFTRFIFYRGRKSAELVDKPVLQDFDDDSLVEFLSQALQADDQENRFEWLRSLKNQVMLTVLLRRLSKKDNLQENEAALTRLAVATLLVSMKIAGIDLERTECKLAILGMGRIAGYEMNYGSDLDLIFLYDDSSEVFRNFVSEKVRFLLRNMSIQTATGVLYDIDMRLRPHGTSGALLTSVQSFLEYHRGKREIWERQMMTRCRPVIDMHGIGSRAMEQIGGEIYRTDFDQRLAEEILFIRRRVQDELGSHRDKYDIKRGRGGIMDIDFLCHYLQLKHGHARPALQSPSTRAGIAALQTEGILSDEQAACLGTAYDFFKAIEACLRLFDMKSVSTFPVKLNSSDALVRAMGYEGPGGGTDFLQDYRDTTESVHELYTAMLEGAPWQPV